ncbi:MAG: DUF4340 domain-containing protein [Brevinematales bacterium]|nr:DUF4340 domain-containing protein [Brevinematales bacterium]
MPKKNTLSLVIWLGLFLCVTGIYLLFQKPWEKKHVSPSIFPWSSDEVVFLSRTFNKTNEIEYIAFQRFDNEWFMVSPIKEKAHPELLHRLLDNLNRITSEQAFVVSDETKWQEYGFSPYLYRFVISNTQGETFTLDIGSISVGQNYYYVRINNSPTNYQVYTFNLVDLVQDRGEYLWPDIFDIPFDNLEKVLFFFQGKKIVELHTNAGGWEMVYPENRLLTNFSVKSLLLDFYPIQADHFVTFGLSPSLLRQYGLSSPRYGVIFVGQGRSNTLWVGTLSKDGFLHAYSHEKQGIFAVSESEIISKWITQASQLTK